jgi:hypothetical protein
MAGQAPQTQVHQAPGGQASPGYGFAKDFYNSLGGVAQNPFPGYQGQIDPGLSPTMQNVIRQSQGYSQSGPSEILQGAQGSLGRFMTPSFMDPRMRLPMGAPSLFGVNPQQKMFGGQMRGQLGQGFAGGGGMQFQGGGGLQSGAQMNQGMPQFGGQGPQMGRGRMESPFGQGGGMQPYQTKQGTTAFMDPNAPMHGMGGGMQSAVGPGLQSGGGPQMAFRGGQQPTQGPDMQNLNGGGFQAALGALQGPQGQFQGQVGGQASKAWDMGNQANRGQVVDGKIWMGGGQGGDSGQWQNYDPNNWGQKQTADLFSRYGSNWAAGAGSGGTGAHSSEMKPWLQNWLGRDPTQQEEQDLYYGVNPAEMQKIKAAFAAQSAAFDPSSASYDPNARYSSAAYRGKGRPALPGGGGAPGQGQVQGGQQDMAALLSGLTKRG